MDDAKFDKVGRAELRHLEDRLEAVDPDDVDFETSDGVLRLDLRDGVRIVINTHRAARQIWMAGVDTAWHFDFQESDGLWRTSDHEELRTTLANLIQRRIGLQIDF